MAKQRFLHTKGRLRKVLSAFFVVLGAVFIFQVIPALAQSQYGLEYGTLTGLGTQDLRVTVMRIVRIALGFLGILAILIILYAGFVWMTSGGNEEKVETAKRTLRNAAIGLLIIFFAYAIVSFIINALISAFGGGVGGGPPGGCTNCDHLGSGILESVYPVPGQTNVARNTNIMVTFKVEMDPSTIIRNGVDAANAACSAASITCSGKLRADNVIIKFPGESGEVTLTDNDVDVSTVNGRTYVFNPVALLGSPDNDTWHTVRLNSGIRKDNGTTAFPGARGFFEWMFQVGTYLDLDPAEIMSVFPPPDNLADSYSLVAATFAGGEIAVNLVPRVAQGASVDTTSYALTPYPPNSPRLVIGSGTYNGTFRGTARFAMSYTAPGTGTATVSYPAGNAHPTNGASRSFPITGNAITYGDGLIFRIENPTAGADAWDVVFTPVTTADTLQINSPGAGGVAFTFVAGTTGANQIQVGADPAITAQNIESAINANSSLPVRVSARSSGTLELTAKTAGTSGNLIALLASQSGGRAWASVTPMASGEEPSLKPTTRSAPDQPRNAIFQISFNEAITPDDLANGIITVERDVNTDPAAAPDWRSIAFVPQISNLYRTVELLSTEECLDETTGKPVENSCGDKIFCWPFNNPTPYEATHYRVTVKAGLLKDNCTTSPNSCQDAQYGQCISTPGGTGTVCSGTTAAGLVYFYPEARTNADGIVDAANNSMNGNRDDYTLGSQILGRAEGPQAQSGQPAFELNKVCSGTSNSCLVDADCAAGVSCVYQAYDRPSICSDEPNKACSSDADCQTTSGDVGRCFPQPPTQGDDFIWEFYINKNLDLVPPDITSVGPNILGTGAHLIAPSESQFDKLMSEATFKPGANYMDGYCGCSFKVCSNDLSRQCTTNGDCVSGGTCGFADVNAPAAQGSCSAGQLCKIRAGTVGRCTNEDSAQIFCLEDRECQGFDDPANGLGGGNVLLCKNRKYFSLLDRAAVKAAYWVTGSSRDLTNDTYFDVTKGQLQHTRLQPITNYATEIGSGVKDIYQNCYLPSQGPHLSRNAPVCSRSGLACNSDQQCPAGERCLSQVATTCGGSASGDACAADIQCTSGETCRPIQRCENNGNACSQSSDCPGSRCIPMTCLTPDDLDAGRGFCCNGAAMTETEWKADLTCATAY